MIQSFFKKYILKQFSFSKKKKKNNNNNNKGGRFGFRSNAAAVMLQIEK